MELPLPHRHENGTIHVHADGEDDHRPDHAHEHTHIDGLEHAHVHAHDGADHEHEHGSSNARTKGSGALGPVRSLRLPKAIDRWFGERLRDDPNRPASDVLLVLVHGGLRLRPGYMSRQPAEIERMAAIGQRTLLETHVRALRDSFGESYVRHLEDWIANDSETSSNITTLDVQAENASA